MSVEGVDQNSVNPPVTPNIGQRVVSIDPGRRDMVVALAMKWTDEHDKKSSERFPLVEEKAEVIKMSTKQHVFESKRNHSKRHTNLHLKRQNVSINGQVQDMKVADYQSKHLLSPK